MSYKKVFIFTFSYLMLFYQVSASIFISEIFPNTIDDTNLEYIELKNIWDTDIYLSWYTLKDKSEKEYIFWPDDILYSNSSQKFLRITTKIILNNTDEELFLYDNSWNLLDTLNYTTSEKWEIITHNIEIINPIEENIEEDNEETTYVYNPEEITQTWTTNTWSITESWSLTETWVILEVIIEENTQTWTTNTWSFTESWSLTETGSLDENLVEEITETWSISETWSLEIIQEEKILQKSFDILFSLQRPTYFVEEIENLSVYNCDRTKEECKLNLDLRNSFTWSYKETDFNCFIDFWFWTWVLTWEENKCNPWTVTIPVWNYTLNLKIENKTNSWIFSTWSFSVINNWYIKPQTIVIYQSSLTPANNVQTNENIYISKPEIQVQSWLDEKNNCIKNDCKVNFNYIKKNEKETCLWDFWWWFSEVKDIEKKCNPWYLQYWIWTFKVKLKVYEKDKEYNYNENTFQFENIKIQQEEEKQEKEEKIEEIKIEKSDIDQKDLEQEKYKNSINSWFSMKINRLKSWLKIYWTTIPNSEITINFKKNELSFFNLIIPKVNAENIYSTKSNELWEYQFLLTDIFSWNYIIETSIIDNFWKNINIEKTKKLELKEEYITQMKAYVDGKTKKNQEKISSKKEDKTNNEKLNNNEKNSIEKTKIPLKWIISIQWKLWTKKISWNNIYCTDSCSINFDWSKSLWKIKKYIWNFWNWEYFDWKNPKYISYKNPWNYKVSLLLIWENLDEAVQYFNVFFSKKEKVSSSPKLLNNLKKKNILVDVTNAQDQDEENQENNWNLYFFIILIFSSFLIFLLLRREKVL